MSADELISPILCPTTWPLVRLNGTTKKIGSGATPTGGQAAYQDSRKNYALVRSQNVFDRSFSESGLAFISDEQAGALKNVQLQEDDLLLNITGDGVTFGRTCMVPVSVLPACVNQHVSIIRLDQSKADPGYVLSDLTHPTVKEYVEAFNAGGSRRAITKAHIESFVVPLPPLSTQKFIAQTLSALDDRITLLRETNATLEAIAQALFKSWFVDFDPVRAKMEGHIPEGMDAATAALFPDEFEESELGLVSKGWRVTALAETFDINPTQKLSKGSKASYLDMASLATSAHCVEAPIDREMGSGAKFQNGDTLLARITPCLENGKSAFVDFLAEGQIGWGSTEFLVLRPKAPLPQYLGYLLCRHPAFREHAIQSMSGTSGRQRIQNDVLGRYLLAVPDLGITTVFAGVIQPIQKSIAANHQSAQTLATLPDTLLPRLISGQLRLPEALALLEGVAA